MLKIHYGASSFDMHFGGHAFNLRDLGKDDARTIRQNVIRLRFGDVAAKRFIPNAEQPAQQAA